MTQFLTFLTTIFKETDLDLQGSVFGDFFGDLKRRNWRIFKTPILWASIFLILFVKTTTIFVKEFVMFFTIFLIFSRFCKICVNLLFLLKAPFLLSFSRIWRGDKNSKNNVFPLIIFFRTIIFISKIKKVTIFCACRKRVGIHVRSP